MRNLRISRNVAFCLAAAFFAAADAPAINRAVSEETDEEVELGSSGRSNLWFRVICGKSNPSAALAIFIRHGCRPYYQTASVTKNGLKPGAIPPGGRKACLQRLGVIAQAELLHAGRKVGGIAAILQPLCKF